MYMHTNASMHECVTLHCTQNGVKLITKANGTAAAAANTHTKQLQKTPVGGGFALIQLCVVYTLARRANAQTTTTTMATAITEATTTTTAMRSQAQLGYLIAFFLSLSREFVQIKSDGNFNSRVGIMLVPLPLPLPLPVPRTATSIIIARVARVAIVVVVSAVFRFLFAACCCCRLLCCFMRPQNVLQSHDSQQQQQQQHL